MSKTKTANRPIGKKAAAEAQIREIKRFSDTLTSDSARRFLEQAGIVTKKGKLTANYR